MSAPCLRAPFPWHGGKSRAAEAIWNAFGNVPNYVEPFAGSLAVLLGRPHAPKHELANDLDCYLANFWRAVQHAPGEVAGRADGPMNEADLHARHIWLVSQIEFRERMLTDPNYYDAQIAGWWAWGVCAWMGGGWCARPEPLRNLPSVGEPGRGVLAPTIRPRIDQLIGSMSQRLRHTRVTCGDWSRVLGLSTLGTDPSGKRRGMSPCAILLDPPYDDGAIDYAVGGRGIAADVRAWAIEHGDNPGLRIALCGYEGDHAMPDGWRAHAWRSKGNSANASRERIWFSPHCLTETPTVETAPRRSRKAS